jgi:TetR/AcrR family transcriptional regulator of autoinduction and epiphytic fitness
MAASKKTRRKRDTIAKRKEILAGAIQVFSENGFDTSSMDAIAKIAGVSKRTVYNHFASKESLFQAIIADFLAEKDKIKPIEYSNERSLREQLIEFAWAEIHLIDDPVRRGLSKLLTATFLMDIDFGKRTRSQYEPYKEFVAWLERAKADKKIKCDSPLIAARIFYGMVEGCLTWSALFTDGESLMQADFLLDEIVAVFLSNYGNDIPTIKSVE